MLYYNILPANVKKGNFGMPSNYRLPVTIGLSAIAIMVQSVLFWPAHAQDSPRIVVDIRPLAGLVSQITKDVDMPAPEVLVKAGVSVHDMHLRPSQARSLQSADIVFLVGAGLITGIERSAQTLSRTDNILILMDQPKTVRHGIKTSAVHHHHHDHDDHDGHEDHNEHEAHDDHNDHKAHKDHDGHDEHDDSGETIDPHGWLDPVNAHYWLAVIADRLSKIDPANADAYRTNANEAQQHISQLHADIAALIEPAKGQIYLVVHDSLAYFDARFDMGISAVLTDAFSEQITPGRLGDVITFMSDNQIDCVVTDPETAHAVEELFTNKQDIAHVRLDLFGYDYPIDNELYQKTLLSVARNLASCGAS